MQSTGQASTQAVSLVPTQGSAITKAIEHLRLSEPSVRPTGEEVQAGGIARASDRGWGHSTAVPPKIVRHDKKGFGQEPSRHPLRLGPFGKLLQKWALLD